MSQGTFLDTLFPLEALLAKNEQILKWHFSLVYVPRDLGVS